MVWDCAFQAVGVLDETENNADSDEGEDGVNDYEEPLSLCEIAGCGDEAEAVVEADGHGEEDENEELLDRNLDLVSLRILAGVEELLTPII